MSTSRAYPQQTGLRKRGCNEDCLYRIASHLCQLEASDQDRAACSSEQSGPGTEDDCCKPAASVVESCADDCCKPADNAEESCADDCCIPAADSKDSCKPSVDTNKASFADDCCKPSTSSEDRCADKCCKPSADAEKTDGAANNSCDPSDIENGNCSADCCTSVTDDQVNGTGELGIPSDDNCAEKCCIPSESSCVDECCKSSDKDTDSYSGDKEECTTTSCCQLNRQEARPGRTTSCEKHIGVAFARFESLIRQGQCLCRRLMNQMNFCCCSGGGVACKSHVDASPTRPSECKTDLFNKTARAEITRDQGTPKASGATPVESRSKDVESTAACEHVVLNVSGMTCTGCSKKLMNVLGPIPGISNPKVTFVSGTAAFDLEQGHGVMGVEDILPLIEKQTGFKLSRLISGYQHLDVLLEPSMAHQIERGSPNGFVSIEKISGKQRYRITYNPTIVGVRDLLPPSVQLAPPVPDPSITEGKRRLASMTRSFALSAIFTIPVVVLNWSTNPVARQTREIVSLVLASFVQAIAVPEFYVGAVKSLVFSRVVEMDMLVVISITAAYFYSVVAFALYEAGIAVEEAAFFETSSLLITLVLLGRLIAAYARVRAVSAVSLRSLQAETTRLVKTEGQIVEMDARLLQFGDTIQIPPHTRVVTDGDVVSGESTVDESMLTGESDPVVKQVGDGVIAGTVNGPSVLTVRLTRLPGANRITDIANLVENALGSKPRIQDIADKVASWFIPSVVAIALLTFVIWIVVTLKVRGQDAGAAIGTAVTYGIAVLAISCPCALGLAVPMVLVIAGGVAARAGVVIKGADAIERGYKTTDVVFDKTGTLTKGDLTVVHESSPPVRQFQQEEVLALTAFLVSGNNHPVSQAMKSYLKTHDRLDSIPVNVNSVAGAGIEAKWDSFSVKAGNPYWTSTDSQPCVREIIKAGMTAFCVTIDGSLVLAFGLTSTIRDEAASVIAKLQGRNIRCHIVSGDTDETVQNVASRVGIDVGNVVSRSSPAQKMEYVKRLQSEGRIVLFCGDGTNDAVAVAQANVGVQMGVASDVINGVCDVTLLGGLEGVLALLAISKRAFARITFNFVWTAVYNLFAILLASGAFVKFRIPPAYAGLGEVVSVCPVIAVAVTLVWGKN